MDAGHGGRVSVTTQVDPITLGVVAGTLSSTVNEMTVIQRTARSPVSRSATTSPTRSTPTVNGVPEMVVQGEDQPVHLGGMLVSVKSVAATYGDDLAPGDVIVRNEPVDGRQPPADIDVIEPVFVGRAARRLVACSRAPTRATSAAPFRAGTTRRPRISSPRAS